MKHLICILFMFLVSPQVEAQSPPVPKQDAAANGFFKGWKELRAKRFEEMVKIYLEVKISREKKKLPWRQDKELINKYQTLLDSPTAMKMVLEKGQPLLEQVEMSFFEARGPPADAKNWEVVLDKIIEFIENGGLEKILEFVLTIIDAVAVQPQVSPAFQPPLPTIFDERLVLAV